jgi:hypothetical protein
MRAACCMALLSAHCVRGCLRGCGGVVGQALQFETQLRGGNCATRLFGKPASYCKMSMLMQSAVLSAQPGTTDHPCC